MNDFIKVIGSDSYYKEYKTGVKIAINSIKKICPIYVTNNNWRCLPEHPEAKISGYELTTMDGIIYECYDPKEWQMLGPLEEHPKNEIGFSPEND